MTPYTKFRTLLIYGLVIMKVMNYIRVDTNILFLKITCIAFLSKTIRFDLLKIYRISYFI